MFPIFPVKTALNYFTSSDPHLEVGGEATGGREGEEVREVPDGIPRDFLKKK